MNYMLLCGCLLPLQTETIVYKVLRRKRFKIYASLEMVIIDKCHVYCDK